jgi:type II secretory pathway component GspD/PulD (secretin)
MLGILGGMIKPLNYVNRLTIIIVLISMSQTIFAAKARMIDDVTLFQLGKIVAEELNYAIIFSPRVRGNSKIAMVLSEPVEPGQLYNFFLSVLNMHGYAAVKSGDLIRVVRERKVRTMYSDF